MEPMGEITLHIIWNQAPLWNVELKGFKLTCRMSTDTEIITSFDLTYHELLFLRFQPALSTELYDVHMNI